MSARALNTVAATALSLAMLAGCSQPQPRTDQQLATLLRDAPALDLEVFPIDPVRQSGPPTQAVQPAQCAPLVEGLLPLVMKHPAALALTPARLNVTVVDLGRDGDAERELEARQKLIDDPACAMVTVTDKNGSHQVRVAGAASAGAGLESTRALTLTRGQVTRTALFGRRGSTLVMVSSGTGAPLASLEKPTSVVAEQLGR